MDRIDGYKGMSSITEHTPRDYYIRDTRDIVPVIQGNPNDTDTWELVPYDCHSGKF